MAAAFKAGLQPMFDNRFELLLVQGIPGQAQHVGIVVPAAHFGSMQIVTNSSSNSSDLIGGDRNADSGSANQHAESARATGDRPGDLHGDIWIVDAFGGMGSQVKWLGAATSDCVRSPSSLLNAAVITADANFHAYLLRGSLQKQRELE
jgi:hypothetical protein